MLARLDGQHHLMRRQHGRGWVDATCQGLAQDKDVGLGTIMVARENRASAAKAGLHLICDEKHIVLLAHLLHAAHVAVVGDDDARLTLDWLDHEGTGLLAVGLQFLLQRLDIVVGDIVEVRHERPEAAGGARVVRGADGCDGAPPEVAMSKHHPGFPLRDALDVVAPAACELDRCLAALHTCVHRQDAVKPEVLCGELGVVCQDLRVERTRRERQRLALLCKGPDDLWVAVALVHCGVRRQEVVVLAPVDIPDADPVALAQHDR
mmetsp:Transcript_68942/g.177673  ORF Transcript_68942/g.177673 Transcript_68942/m.177673 type:complete len:264 (+) Transcript_68942:584-1375(+)